MTKSYISSLTWIFSLKVKVIHEASRTFVKQIHGSGAVKRVPGQQSTSASILRKHSMHFTIARPLSFKHTKKPWFSSKEKAGKRMQTLRLTTLRPGAHAICSSQRLCFLPALVNIDSQRLPHSAFFFLGGGESYQPIPDGFHVAGLRGWALERRLISFVGYDKPCTRASFFFFLISISFAVKAQLKCSEGFPLVPRGTTCVFMNVLLFCCCFSPTFTSPPSKFILRAVSSIPHLNTSDYIFTQNSRGYNKIWI